ncbi:unnamed protein product [Cuscuta epithymum]|uniref:Plastid lipid-associated protein/fibrillin conserved domain-containing protein n=1 Tax=Cuscuta epithymum TaxID=186058 RepID=A0AAV0DHA3_9ASTE|nr:unnamed protein product [Cuscuta epithymum]CAH9128804.1 unnamed protein product [Cuscuta epithymum]
MASFSALTTNISLHFVPNLLPVYSFTSAPTKNPPPQQHHKLRIRRTPCASALAVASPGVSKPDLLVNSLLSKVLESDRGLFLSREEHKKVAEMAHELEIFCVDQPVNCPLIFGDGGGNLMNCLKDSDLNLSRSWLLKFLTEWDVVYCSNPTSPGGFYRSTIGRLFFKTKEMIQVLEAPDIVRNKVGFSLLGFIDGEVSLKGKLKVVDEKWIEVVFTPPNVKIGGLELKYGGESEVKLQILYIDEKMRLGRGSRGSLFVFHRRHPSGLINQ